MVWFENEIMLKMSREHDVALLSGNISEIEALIEDSSKLAEDSQLHPMIRAKHYYNAATSTSGLINLKKIKNLDLEYCLEKVLFFYRKSIELQKSYLSKSGKFNLREEGNFWAVYHSAVVNYSNILSSIGRIPSAISAINDSATKGFGMAIGNLGGYLKHYGDMDYDTGHRYILYQEALKLFKMAIESTDDNVYEEARQHFGKDFNEIFSIFINAEYDDVDVSSSQLFMDANRVNWADSSINEARRYSNWKAYNSLALNTLNDFDKSTDRDNDCLHLPNMIFLKKNLNYDYHGLFNQIKQEYCSSRYLIFDGIYNRTQHFSDKGVFMVDTLDYPVYSLNIEKIKSGYRAIYSIFDRIAFFLNEYLNLGIGRRKINFNILWPKGDREKDHNNIYRVMENNYLLRGLYWIKKDLYNSTESGYKGIINPSLRRAYFIRNALEHRYLKIVDDWSIKPEEANDSSFDFDMVVSQHEFECLAIELLKTVREAIILLTQIVYFEERQKDKTGAVPITLTPYLDDWKI